MKFDDYLKQHHRPLIEAPEIPDISIGSFVFKISPIEEYKNVGFKLIYKDNIFVTISTGTEKPQIKIIHFEDLMTTNKIEELYNFLNKYIKPDGKYDMEGLIKYINGRVPTNLRARLSEFFNMLASFL